MVRAQDESLVPNSTGCESISKPSVKSPLQIGEAEVGFAGCKRQSLCKAAVCEGLLPETDVSTVGHYRGPRRLRQMGLDPPPNPPLHPITIPPRSVCVMGGGMQLKLAITSGQLYQEETRG